MRCPSLAGFRLHLGETGACGRIGNADEMLAGGTLNLPSGVTWIALQRLIAVGTVEFEVGCVRCVHRLHANHAQIGRKKYMTDLLILFVRPMRM
jgi:hypothetical protein